MTSVNLFFYLFNIYILYIVAEGDYGCGGPEKLDVIGDNIIVLYHEVCDIRGNYIEFMIPMECV